MPGQPSRPIDRDRAAVPCIWIPDDEGTGSGRTAQSHGVAGISGRDRLEIRAIFIPDGYDGKRPGYPWVEVGRMALGQRPATIRATAARSTPLRVDDPAAITGRATAPRTAGPGPEASPPAPLGQPLDAAATGSSADGGVTAVYPDIAATICSWNAVSGPRDALAGLDATSPSNPIVVSLAKGRYLPDEGRLTAGDGAAQGNAPSAYGSVQRAQAVIVMPPLPPVAAAPADDPALAASNYISRTLQGILANQGEEPDQSRSKPPIGSRPIDKTQWAGDHRAIKEGIGAAPADDVQIAPDGEVWSQSPDGSWTDHGPAGDYTGSGRPSGRTGRDRERQR